MSISYSPNFIIDGLKLHYDAANLKSFKGVPTTNTVSYAAVGAQRYNNPGFAGSITQTEQTFLGSPVWEVIFRPQDVGRITRLGSSEGFGFYHGMGIRLFPDTRYMASVYFRTEYPLASTSTQGFVHSYSNIAGWGANGTTSTRYQEFGWTRLYTQFYVNLLIGGNSYMSRTVSNTLTVPVNTNQTTQVLVTVTIQANGTFSVSTDAGNTTTGSIVDFANHEGVRSANPTITNAGGIPGLLTGTNAVLQHGLDDSTWTKLSDANFVLKSAYPFNYYVLLNIPSTSGVTTNISINLNMGGFYSSLLDNKFYKVTFNVTDLKLNEDVRTYWAAPMLEEHSRSLPSKFVIGTRGSTVATGGGLFDISRNNNHGELINAPNYDMANNSIIFDGVDDRIQTNYGPQLGDFTVIAWFRSTGDTLNYNRIVDKDYVSGLWIGRQASNANKWGGGVLENSSPFGRYITLEDGQWHMIVSRRQGNIHTIFGDGVDNNVSGTVSTALLSTTNFAFGNYSGSNNSQRLTGNIAIVSIYDRALTLKEIQQNYNCMRGRFGL